MGEREQAAADSALLVTVGLDNDLGLLGAALAFAFTAFAFSFALAFSFTFGALGSAFAFTCLMVKNMSFEHGKTL